MSISSPDDVDYIDTESPLIAPKMEEESSSIETVYTPSEKAAIKQRLEQLRSSPSYDALLSIQRMAKLCQEQTRLRHRIAALENKIEERNHLNRLEMVKLDVLRAEKSKSNENINWITTKSVELDSRLNQLRTEIRETKNKVQDTKTDCLKRGRKILAEYYKIINGEKIIDSISKMTPTIKPVLPEIKCSSKTKKMLEENSVILQAQNISRFLNYTSGIFLYPLRFSANFGNIETHNDSGTHDEAKYESFTYLDRNAYLLIQSNLFHLEGSRYVKKNSSLEKFLLSSKSDHLNGSALHHRKGESKMLRNALFATSSSTSSNSIKAKKREIESDIPDLT